MGNCTSLRDLVGRNSPDATQSHIIDKQIKADEKRMKTEVKILLLGAGESGKSTILKQMKLIHASGFSESERETFRMVVFSNIVAAMQTLFEAVDQLNISLKDPSLLQYKSFFEDAPLISNAQPYPQEYLEPLKQLWSDSGIQEACQHGNAFALHDNIHYFFDDLDRLWQPGYLPNDQDIIRCRAKTTGIIETIFHLGPLTYHMFDVGGQRSERKKWIHCFENVTAILFVVAISGYDQCLVEDRDSNQMQEALMLFDTICNSKWFVHTSMILFLNKIDIFKKKILTSPVSKWFPDFRGDNNDLEQTRTYFKRRFQHLNRSTEKRVYSHYTDATDTNLLQHVMMAVSDIILNENLNTLML
ncbi:heterotrimeric G-protein alpha subunit (G-alpha, GPA2) [Radiomyces spectabilis]|uniref:heterotrimeric G-protein alpha subunit (G-alpha, GPA2) n=1 Tax=Radiomyces spectabilis TaxID=64574 RepID=UPI00221FCF46|nr:heterotrimeric G-protein alpha subunit (G-alpha, GPA2) [Radiomyces spectabilis]KAI8384501.1 heterotrimeric G-protein alpha subunit (G-alpha, GPA2) [Radiomyces spectabilis]